jgi:hypothetical protein
MNLARARLVTVVAGLVGVTMVPSWVYACGDHAGHPAPKLLDKSSIPASAFRYVTKPNVPSQAVNATPMAPVFQVPALPTVPPR